MNQNIISQHIPTGDNNGVIPFFPKSAAKPKHWDYEIEYDKLSRFAEKEGYKGEFEKYIYPQLRLKF